jgi:hypothetical protein
VELSVTDGIGAKTSYQCLVRADLFAPEVVALPVEDMPEMDRLVTDLPCFELRAM